MTNARVIFAAVMLLLIVQALLLAVAGAARLLRRQLADELGLRKPAIDSGGCVPASWRSPECS